MTDTTVLTWQHVVIALLNFLTVLLSWHAGRRAGVSAPRQQWSSAQRDEYRRRRRTGV